jgi:hypothetical protein
MLALPVNEPLCADAPAANPKPSGKAAELPRNFLREMPLMINPPALKYFNWYLSRIDLFWTGTNSAHGRADISKAHAFEMNGI